MAVGFAWGASSWHGWGVIGLNVLLSYPRAAFAMLPDLSVELSEGDPRRQWLQERVLGSVRLQRDMLEGRGLASIEQVWLALGDRFEPPELPVVLDPAKVVAFPVFEDLAVAEGHVERLRLYPLVVAASRWNRDFLEERGVAAELWHQGYDAELFHPGVRRARSDGRFRVFSGGKCEWRKGQDLVLRGFSRFAGRHDDAVLVAAWGSPWPGLAMSFAAHDIAPPPGAWVGMPNYRAWAREHGLDPGQVEVVLRRPNWRMAEVYGGVDVAVFPNRAEGGTNLVAMEVLGCGVPAYVRPQTGQADLVGRVDPSDDDQCVEAMVAWLERAYDAGGEVEPEVTFGSHWAWPERCRALAEYLGGR